MKNYDYIIVGGGIAGLYTAYNILKNKQTTKAKVLVIESSNKLGGRIQTIYNSKTEVYEAGAARFSDNHKLLNDLLKDLKLIDKKTKISNDVIFYPIPKNMYDKLNKKYKTFDDIIAYINKKVKELKITNNELVNTTLLELAEKIVDKDFAKFMEHRYQYFSELKTLNAKEGLHTFTKDFNLKTDYYVLYGGLSLLINTIQIELKKMGCQFVFNKYITDITSQKTDNTTIYTVDKYTTTNLVLAIPQKSLLQIKYLKPITKLIKCVKCEPLYRIYAKYPKGENGKVWFNDLPKISTNLQSKFIIPYNYDNGIIMISYTDGKYAKYWLNKYINSSTDTDNTNNNTDTDNIFKKELDKQFKLLFPDKNIPKPKWIKHYYWDCGAAYWTKGCDSDVLMKKILHPFPDENLFICGENYSQYQAWIEGGLQTSKIITDIMKNMKNMKNTSKNSNKNTSNKNKVDKTVNISGGNKEEKTYTMEEVRKHNKRTDAWTVINNKVYDITNWINSHPGGDIILKAVGKDATSMFKAIGHSDNAKKILNGFKIGNLQ